MPKEKNDKMSTKQILFNMNREVGEIGTAVKAQEKAQDRVESSILKLHAKVDSGFAELHEKIDKDHARLVSVEANQNACPAKNQQQQQQQHSGILPAIIRSVLANKGKAAVGGVGATILAVILSLL